MKDACTSVVVTRADNGQGADILGWKAVVGYYDYHQWQLTLVETLEKAEAETAKSLKTIFAAAGGKLLVVPQAEPFQKRDSWYGWQLTEIGKALKARFSELAKAPEDLTRENIAEKIEAVRAEAEKAKAEIGGRHVEVSQLIAKTEAEVNAKVEAMSREDRQLIEAEIGEARQAIDEAKNSLKSSAYENAEAACALAVEGLAGVEVMLAEIRQKMEQEAAELQGAVERGEILVNFEAYKRRMGASGNGDAWVVRPDGTLREADEFAQRKMYPEGGLKWARVEADELALTWSCGTMRDITGSSDFKVAKMPVGGLTEAQREAVRRIETEDIGTIEGVFGIDPEANTRRERFVGEVRAKFPKCPACQRELAEENISYSALVSGYGLHICSCENIPRLVNWNRPFDAATEGRNAQVVLSRAISTGVIEALAYEKWGSWNLNLRWREFRDGESSAEMIEEKIGDGSFEFVGKRDFRCSCGGFAQVTKSEANAYRNGAEIELVCGKCGTRGMAKVDAKGSNSGGGSGGLDLVGLARKFGAR